MTIYNIINYIDCTAEQHQEILALRNHDEVRKWMVNPEIISEKDHFHFVENLRNNDNKLYFAIYKDGTLVGTYNLTNEGRGVWERGIIANPAIQGTGQTKQWEQQILNGLSKYGIMKISAKVKTNNPRSIRYHEKMGFVEIGRNNGYIYYHKDING